MLISGHIGLTLGIFGIIRQKKKSLSYQTAFVLSVFALLPDILDRTLNYTIAGYPKHAIFHSIFFYFAALLICYLFFRRAFIYMSVMGMNALFDIVNANLRAFVYPLNQLFPSIQRHALLSPMESFMEQLPEIIRYKLPTGHYLVFELVGLFFIVLTLVHIRIGRDKEIVYCRDAPVPSAAATGQTENAERIYFSIASERTAMEKTNSSGKF